MKTTYSADVDGLYVSLVQGRKGARCVHLNQDWAIDVEVGGRVLGVEVLQASRYFLPADLIRLGRSDPALPPDSRLEQLRAALAQPAIAATRRGRRLGIARGELERFLVPTRH